MNYKALSIAMLGLLFSTSPHSASIYKCTKSDKSVIFTDKTCPANTTTTLVHKETEQEIQKRQQAEKISTIKRLIEGNQASAAKEYAAKNNLSEQYYDHLSIYSNQKSEEEKRKAEEEKQQQFAIEQQKLILQKQQLAAEKAKIEAEQRQQQQRNNQNYYAYPYYRTIYRTPNPVPNSNSQTKNISGGMNPPLTFSYKQPFPNRNEQDKREHKRHERDRRK